MPNTITSICISKASSSIGALHRGEQIHSEIVSERLIGKVQKLDTALVDMYVKCGEVGKVQKVLKGLSVQVVASWNALISRYSQSIDLARKHGILLNKCKMMVFLRMQTPL